MLGAVSRFSVMLRTKRHESVASGPTTRRVRFCPLQLFISDSKRSFRSSSQVLLRRDACLSVRRPCICLPGQLAGPQRLFLVAVQGKSAATAPKVPLLQVLYGLVLRVAVAKHSVLPISPPILGSPGRAARD